MANIQVVLRPNKMKKNGTIPLALRGNIKSKLLSDHNRHEMIRAVE